MDPDRIFQQLIEKALKSPDPYFTLYLFDEDLYTPSNLFLRNKEQVKLRFYNCLPQSM